MHTARRQALERQTITEARDPEGAAEPSDAGVKKPENPAQSGKLRF